ncbi:MAG: dehydrogenase, partial [Pseudomonadota bacterium]
MSKTFTQWTLGGEFGEAVDLANRLVIAPMCQYSAVDGQANDWHLTHWTNMLNSGAGLFIIEATAVTKDGRISPGCLGLWDDQTAAALEEHLQRARAQAPSMPVCIQLSHAGRKGSSAAPWLGGAQLSTAEGGWETLAPSAVPHAAGEVVPTEMTTRDIEQTIEAFVQAAARAGRMGIDAIELHAAHGYLMHQFLSPLSNHRTDAYGGD